MAQAMQRVQDELVTDDARREK
eukprot:COSAG02_NODE_40966_length_399_cov_1.163333_2_plen_21_part_01